MRGVFIYAPEDVGGEIKQFNKKDLLLPGYVRQGRPNGTMSVVESFE